MSLKQHAATVDQHVRVDGNLFDQRRCDVSIVLVIVRMNEFVHDHLDLLVGSLIEYFVMT